jgi:hypothetical protein
MRNAYKSLFGMPEGKGPLRITKRRWEDNIRRDLRGILWKVVDSIHLV